MAQRRAGAPRLIEWTGERCVPWAPDPQLIYEHFHRYLWAQPLVSGRRVLDLGSGEGFGAALLADTAAAVMGVDVDEVTIEHARLNYAAPNLDFRVGSATALDDHSDYSFDVVVAFEVIEHIADQAAVLREVDRVLGPGGLLIVSTPDRRTYSATGDPNPFHERELTLDELSTLLGSRFERQRLLTQHVAAGSRIESLGDEGGGHLPLRLGRRGEEWAPAGPPAPFYLIGVASNSELPELPAESTLSDYGIEIVRREQERVEEALESVKDALDSAEEARAAAAEAETALARAGRAATQAEREVLRHSKELMRRDGVVSDAHAMAEAAAAKAEAVRAESARARRPALRPLVRRARGRLRGVLRRRGSPSGEAAAPAPAEEPLPAFVFPEFAEPAASIVIPVHHGAELLEKCLRSVLANSDAPYEVIVVDDDADPRTRALLAAATGLRVVRNSENQGFLRSVNSGAEAARGRYIVLLNNDTEPQGRWLSALIERAESDDRVGVVSAKLLYPDGVLQEAGGIVWQDGTAWKYGSGGSSSASEFNYTRDVDYGSGAAMLVRTDLWRELGGFDDRFSPGYWEDVDLCFAARAAGWRVVYEPGSVVVHEEGASMGTDTSIGLKHGQEVNRPVFDDKWRHVLTTRPPSPSHERAYFAAHAEAGPLVLVIDQRLPTPDRDAGSVRLWGTIESLLELGCRVAILPDDMKVSEPAVSRLQGMGVEVIAGALDTAAKIESLGDHLDLAILCRPYVAPRYLHMIRRYAPRARIAYDTVDLHFLREQRRIGHEGGTDLSQAVSFRELELGIMRACDLTFVAGEHERDILNELVPAATVEVLCFAHSLRDEVPGPGARSGLLFVGGFQHDPNVDAALHLGRDIMPRVRTELGGGGRLTIVGPDPPEEVRALAAPDIDVTGWVEDLDPLLERSMVSVAPLRYGAGVKGKVTLCLASGLPVVTSTVGAEGLSARDGHDLMVADDADSFARKVVDLHRDPELWVELSQSGRRLAGRVASREGQMAALRAALGPAL